VSDKFDKVEFIPDFKVKMETFLSKFCEETVKQVLNYCIAFLGDEMVNDSKLEAFHEMVEIWKDATMLFIQTQTHMSRLTVMTPKLGATFDKRYMKEHRSQMDLTDSENGASVSVVMTPWVYLEGDENGEDCETRRHLLPATVLVFEQIESSSDEEQLEDEDKMEL
jgi:hypothetical protein